MEVEGSIEHIQHNSTWSMFDHSTLHALRRRPCKAHVEGVVTAMRAENKARADVEGEGVGSGVATQAPEKEETTAAVAAIREAVVVET